MKRVLFVALALVCASLLTANIASAVDCGKSSPAPSGQVMWAQQSPTPPFPTVRTPVAGYSPNFAAPQPATKATLTEGANRLIRWQGWLDIDAFSVSVLNQMQYRAETEGRAFVGSYTLAEPSIAEAIVAAKTNDPTFKMNPNLEKDAGQGFEGTPTLYVWTYRHSFTDAGLYQLYISVKGKMDIGTTWLGTPPPTIRHRDIQSLGYEFGDDSSKAGPLVERTVFADVEIWRGAVVGVDVRGEIEFVGNEADVIVPPGKDGDPREAVEDVPISAMEKAPSLICNPNYDPRRATGAAFVEPLERAIKIRGNDVQLKAGDVQQRVRTVSPFRYRR